MKRLSLEIHRVHSHTYVTVKMFQRMNADNALQKLNCKKLWFH